MSTCHIIKKNNIQEEFNENKILSTINNLIFDLNQDYIKPKVIIQKIKEGLTKIIKLEEFAKRKKQDISIIKKFISQNIIE